MFKSGCKDNKIKREKNPAFPAPLFLIEINADQFAGMHTVDSSKNHNLLHNMPFLCLRAKPALLYPVQICESAVSKGLQKLCIFTVSNFNFAPSLKKPLLN